jgi:hypothetical protein
MHVMPHLPLEELKRLERAEKDADRSKRMRIVILGREGWTAPAVAMAVGLSRRILAEEFGLLRSLLNTQIINTFLEQFFATIPDGEHAVMIWDGADYDALEEAATTAWRTAVLDQDLMKTVCAAPYLERATSD